MYVQISCKFTHNDGCNHKVWCMFEMRQKCHHNGPWRLSLAIIMVNVCWLMVILHDNIIYYRWDLRDINIIITYWFNLVSDCLGKWVYDILWCFISIIKIYTCYSPGMHTIYCNSSCVVYKLFLGKYLWLDWLGIGRGRLVFELFI